LLSDKYAPTTLNGIIGNYSAVKRLEEFAIKIHKGERTKPVMIFGATGTGKTSAAHALAYGNGFELLELNSGDYRNTETLKKVLLPAARSRGLFSRNIMIFLDEVDELSKKFDAGAESVISQLIRESRQPIVFTATDFWDQKISFLRNAVDKVEFKKATSSEIIKLLEKIVKGENTEISKDVVQEIARRSDGDIRGAINDLEAMLGADASLLESLGMRDRKIEVFGVLDRIFTSGDFNRPRNAVAKSDIDIGMLINWIDENIPKRYPIRSDISNAYQNLSKASLFYEKAGRKSYYGYYRYASILASSGVSMSNSGRVTMLKQYDFPSNIRYLSSSKKDRNAMNSIAERLAPILHTNKKYIIHNYMPMLKTAIEGSIKREGVERTKEIISMQFNLYEDDMEIILGRKLS
jgi:replication factor C large subunit